MEAQAQAWQLLAMELLRDSSLPKSKMTIQPGRWPALQRPYLLLLLCTHTNTPMHAPGDAAVHVQVDGAPVAHTHAHAHTCARTWRCGCLRPSRWCTSLLALANGMAAAPPPAHGQHVRPHMLAAKSTGPSPAVILGMHMLTQSLTGTQQHLVDKSGRRGAWPVAKPLHPQRSASSPLPM